ncbi:MAG: tetratricopeptide repeat protein [Deltaproteobacteria bacterium]|nr:tetratricopeptide repeat protein [Deltaproteobacteria bacterium]
MWVNVRQFCADRRRALVFLPLFVWLFPSSVGATSEQLITEAMRGEQLILNRRYDEALDRFRKLAADHPESPTGTFGELAIWQTRMFENYDFRFAAQYDEALRRHKPTVDRVMAMRDPTDWDLFVCGASLGMQGFYLARTGSWLRALGASDRAMQALHKLLWRNPQFVDAKLGIGPYEFWRSVFTKSIRFLPFFRDQRVAGIAKAEEVAREGQYAREMAQANLGFLYAEEKRYSEAAHELTAMVARYPDNIVLRMQLGQIYLETKEYTKGAAEFRRILAIDPAITKAEFYLGLALTREGKATSEARSAFTHYLATQPERDWAAAAVALLKRLDQRDNLLR